MSGGPTTRVAVAAGHFGDDVSFNVERLRGLVADARSRAVDLLVLPHGALSGYHDHLDVAAVDAVLPAAHDLDGPELGALVDAAGPLVVCVGFTEARPAGKRANTAVCLDGTGLLGWHRKVHLPAGESAAYDAGRTLEPVETRIGTIGLLVDYDKTFPEATRTLACRGAEVVAVPCAWPASRTNRAHSLVRDRQRRLFDLYDQARAAENQIWLLSSNQTGRHGDLRFLGLSKIVAPDGAVVATCGTRAGLVHHDADLGGAVATARRRFHHVAELRPSCYGVPIDDQGRA